MTERERKAELGQTSRQGQILSKSRRDMERSSACVCGALVVPTSGRRGDAQMWVWCGQVLQIETRARDGEWMGEEKGKKRETRGC